MALKLMTLDCCNKKGLFGAYATERQEVIAAIFRDQEPDVVFLQEVPGLESVEKDLERIGYDLNYTKPSNGTSCNAIAVRKSNTAIMLDDIDIKSVNNYESQVEIGRMHVVLLQVEKVQLDMEIILVSWHGPNNTSDDQKKSYLQKLINYLSDLMVTKKVYHLVLAGNFNLSSKEAQGVLDEIVYDYDRPRGRQTVLDYFITINNKLPNIVLDGIYVQESLPVIDGYVATDPVFEHLPVIAYMNPDVCMGTLRDVHSVRRNALYSWECGMTKYSSKLHSLKVTLELNMRGKPEDSEWVKSLTTEMKALQANHAKLTSTWKVFRSESYALLMVSVWDDAFKTRWLKMSRQWLVEFGKNQNDKRLERMDEIVSEFGRPSCRYGIQWIGDDTELQASLTKHGYDRTYKLYQNFVLLDKNVTRFKSWLKNMCDLAKAPERNKVCERIQNWPEESCTEAILRALSVSSPAYSPSYSPAYSP